MRRFLIRFSSYSAFSPITWHLRSLSRSIRFVANRWQFYSRLSARKSFGSLGVYWGFVRSVIRSTSFAVVVAGILYILTAIIVPAMTADVPAWLVSISQQVSDTNKSAYDGLLIAVITVVGLFLTLYLTNLNTVIGTFYVEVSQRIRSLLLQERIGNAYVEFLIFITVFDLVELVIGTALDYRPKYIVVVSAFTGCLAILVFVSLAKRAFIFLDPTLFANVLLRDLLDWSNQSTIKGNFWQDASFQNYFRDQANEAIQALMELYEVANERPQLRKEPLSLFLAKIAKFLSIYVAQKERIPSDSLWYARLPQHQSWYLPSGRMLTIAAVTQTSLMPEMKPNTHWIEDQLLGLQFDALEHCAQDKRIRTMFEILSQLDVTYKILGHQWEIEYAAESFLKLIDFNLLVFQVNTEKDLNKREYQELKENLAVVDMLGLLPINLFLGFVQRVENTNLAAFANTLSTSKWKQRESIYALGLPTTTFEELEHIQRAVDFEIQAEGHIVSPHWYIQQLLCRLLAISFSSQLRKLVDLNKTLYLKQVESLLLEKKIYPAASLLMRGREYFDKLASHLVSLETFTKQLDGYRIIKEIPWPDWQWETRRSELHTMQDAYATSTAALIESLASAQPLDEIPDYFGQAVQATGDAYFRALWEKNVNLAERLFPAYSLGIHRTFGILQGKTTALHSTTAQSILSDPLLDLITIGGYAYLFTEYHQEPLLWENCKQAWERSFQEVPDLLPLLALVISRRHRMPLLSGIALLRGRWDRDWDNLIRSLPRKVGAIPMGAMGPRFVGFVKHPSLLIRTLGGDSPESSHMMAVFTAFDVFVELYLMQKPESRDLDFGSNMDLQRMQIRQEDDERRVRPLDEALNDRSGINDLGEDDEIDGS